MSVGFVFLFKRFKLTRRDDSNEIFATSTRGDITKAEVNEYITELKRSYGVTFDINNAKSEDKRVLAVEIINNKILLERARADGIANSKEFIKRASEARNGLMRGIFMDRLIAKNITEEMVKVKYEEFVNSLKDKKEFEVSHIVVKDEKEINRVLKGLENHTFFEMAAEYSLDYSSKDNGGSIGWIVEDILGGEFRDILVKLPLNKLSKPFKTENGWHIVIKTGERNAVIPSFEKIKASLKNLVTRDFIRDYGINNTKNLEIKVVE
jgi:parvulin-like peptidyl-prolyl isomerase